MEIRPSIHQIVRLGFRIFLRVQLAACKPNFLSGWRRAAMVMIEELLIFLGGGGGKDERYTSIHSSKLICSAVVFFAGSAGRLRAQFL